ncbi:biotin/lipoyl-containing protein [Actibacterium sp. MT2.3-13A]|uniref:biotin/lipoyl-containing protein n=1 Tax=Actibacterium sp. MT2.3-13A TaxID=2828332 RepID=UPI001BAE4728|nr:biotin/lipoyl-containing protein [Actibacterium sp. MT2.3-13A]
MPHEVIMPALGMAQDTGLIVAWHKSPGDEVATGDVLFEVETDKATMEVEAQADGFLTQVRAHAGDEVPVGDVIALIGDTTEAVHTAESPAGSAAATAALPDGNEVIMPALGMAQDTGLIVAWHKAPGDAVAADDILFEVETDKATMEVEAGHDGYVAALLAEAGEDAPVGDLIAIISAAKPDAPVQLSRKGQPAAAAPAPAAEAPPQPAADPVPEKPAGAAKPAAKSETGRILASPKARRLALEQGLDLARLVVAGHPQPYHVSDIEVLKSLPDEGAGTAQAAAARHLVADLPGEGFTAFAAWAAETAGLKDADALLAGLAAASLGRQRAAVAVEGFGETRIYTVPAGPFGAIAEAEPGTPPDLRLRDLRFSRITAVRLGAEDSPVLSVAASGAGLRLTLECAAHQLSAGEAVSLLSNFAGRMEQPLRHLL